MMVTGSRDAFAVDAATDVCAAATNPCVISNTVVVDDGAVLDFGTRTLEVQGTGQIDIGAGAASIKCGKFLVNTGTNLGLKVRGASGFGTTDGGNLLVDVLRKCSLKADQPLHQRHRVRIRHLHVVGVRLDRDRALHRTRAAVSSALAARPCARATPTGLCANDAACDIGPCNLTTRRCAADSSVVCFSNTQCNFGPCALTDPRCAGDLSTSCDTRPRLRPRQLRRLGVHQERGWRLPRVQRGRAVLRRRLLGRRRYRDAQRQEPRGRRRAGLDFDPRGRRHQRAADDAARCEPTRSSTVASSSSSRARVW